MGDEWQPEAVVRLRLERLKKEFNEYINVNSEKIDANIPVFFGQVIASLDKTLPGLSDELFDQFIDAMAFAVLEASKRSEEIPFVEKLFDYAMRNKRGSRNRAVYDILLGMKMINTGKYAEGAEQLKSTGPWTSLSALRSRTAISSFPPSRALSRGAGNTSGSRIWRLPHGSR